MSEITAGHGHQPQTGQTRQSNDNKCTERESAKCRCSAISRTVSPQQIKPALLSGSRGFLDSPWFLWAPPADYPSLPVRLTNRGTNRGTSRGLPVGLAALPRAPPPSSSPVVLVVPWPCGSRRGSRDAICQPAGATGLGGQDSWVACGC